MWVVLVVIHVLVVEGGHPAPMHVRGAILHPCMWVILVVIHGCEGGHPSPMHVRGVILRPWPWLFSPGPCTPYHLQD